MELLALRENHHSETSDPFTISTGAIRYRSLDQRNIQKSGSGRIKRSTNILLDSLPKEIFESLWPQLRRCYVRREEFLLQQDDEMQAVYFPETAVLSELHVLEDGRMVEIAITGREGAIAVSALYQNDHRVANCVQVTQAGSILKIEIAMLKKIAAIHPRLLPLLHTSVENYIRQISQKAVCNMYHSVTERFCTWLLMLNDRYGSADLKLTHEQIARTLGVYRPSVTSIALDMRKNELIDYSRGKLSIRNRDKMRNIACGCYSELDEFLFETGGIY